MARIVILLAAILVACSLIVPAEAIPELNGHREALRQRTASSSQGTNRGPFHPPPSKLQEERQRKRMEDYKRRMEDSNDQKRKAAQSSKQPLPNPPAGPDVMQDLLSKLQTPGGLGRGYEFTNEERDVLARRAKKRHEPFDPSTANPANHYFGERLKQSPPGPNATEQEKHAYSTKMAQLRQQYLHSHPRNVQPTSPNFGLRYRVTHVATLSFQAQNLEEPNGAPLELGNITVALFGKSVPKTVENFVGLCNGVKGFGYANSTIHRIIDGFIIQGGDIEMSSDGLGGHSVFAEEEDDEAEMEAVRAAAEGKSKSESRSVSLDNPSDLEKKKLQSSSSKSISPSSSRTKNRYIAHENYLIPHGAGTISMAAAHRSKIGSQFYISLDDESSKHLNRRFVAFGHIIFGFKTTVFAIQRMRVDTDDKPVRTITISSCEAVEYRTEDEEVLAKEGKRLPRSRQLRDDHFTEAQFTKAREEVERLRKEDEQQEEASKSLPQKPREVPNKSEKATKSIPDHQFMAKGPRSREEIARDKLKMFNNDGRQDRFRKHREEMRKRMEERLKKRQEQNE